METLDPHISKMAGATALKLCMQIQRAYVYLRPTFGAAPGELSKTRIFGGLVFWVFLTHLESDFENLLEIFTPPFNKYPTLLNSLQL